MENPVHRLLRPPAARANRQQLSAVPRNEVLRAPAGLCHAACSPRKSTTIGRGLRAPLAYHAARLADRKTARFRELKTFARIDGA
jgi:hypothetical protein